VAGHIQSYAHNPAVRLSAKLVRAIMVFIPIKGTRAQFDWHIVVRSGSCHCGTTRFEVDIELDHVLVCDCSSCRRRGTLNHRVSDEALRLFTPLTDLTVYQWHTGTAKDYFCPKCGIQPFRKPRGYLTDEAKTRGEAPFSGWAINVRCLDGVDLDNIPIRRIHGSQFL
jgi:hypothetical protein